MFRTSTSNGITLTTPIGIAAHLWTYTISWAISRNFFKPSVNRANVKVHMLVEAGAKAVDEGRPATQHQGKAPRLDQAGVFTDGRAMDVQKNRLLVLNESKMRHKRFFLHIKFATLSESFCEYPEL